MLASSSSGGNSSSSSSTEAAVVSSTTTSTSTTASSGFGGSGRGGAVSSTGGSAQQGGKLPPPSEGGLRSVSSMGGGMLGLRPSRPVNVVSKREECEALFGRDLTLVLHLPDNTTFDMKVKEAQEVGYVKLLLAEKIGKRATGIKLFREGRELLDPLSLCDNPGLRPPSADIEVRFV